MDMTVSPDLEAFICYALVFLLGLAAAKGQVGQRLGNLPGQWIMVNTWLLFFAYALLPVALFWLLDRTNAIHDTSVFAALVVGLGYQQILSGGIGTIRAPGEMSKLWQPFAAWADSISDRIRDRIAVNDSKFDERLLSTIRSDPKNFEKLKSLALAHTPNPKDLDDKIKEVDALANVLQDDGVMARKAEFLYLDLKKSSSKTFGYLLYKKGLISKKWYVWYEQEWRSKTAAIAVAIVLTVTVASCLHEASEPEHMAAYYVWRLRKDSATDYDRFRAQQKLVPYLSKNAYQQLASALQTPNLPGKTADNILAVMLRTRGTAAAKDANLSQLLIDSLRTENSDVRLRIYKVLVYLGQEHGMDPKAMQDWQPDPKDTPTRIDEMIKQWKKITTWDR